MYDRRSLEVSKLRKFRAGRIDCMSKCGLVKGGFDELPKHTADGLEIARVEQKVKVEIPFILYLGTVCSIILLAIVVYIYVAIKL